MLHLFIVVTLVKQLKFNQCFSWFQASYTPICTDFTESFFCFTDFLISAAVSEFKGPEIFGVVRLAQVNMELARIEANFSGLSPGKHSWSINEFGDLTRGAASTGKVFNPLNEENTKEVCFFYTFWTTFVLP